MSKHSITAAVKQITVYLTSNANQTPGSTGFTVHLVDPDTGHTGPRTFANGYAVPVPVFIPRDWEVGEMGEGEPIVWAGKTPIALDWVPSQGVMIATCPLWRKDEQISKGDATYLKSLSRSALGV